jgi:L-asparaginase / beta-aspartyl-peptidase
MSETIWSAGGRLGSFGVLVHGGAGTVPNERRALHVEGCVRAARAGAAQLSEGRSALDAVEAAVRALEDDPLFNAGTGACLNAEGDVELDASIMDGRELRAGGVCALAGFREPIAIARAALEDGAHVLYAAAGARAFALGRGFVEVDPERLVTEAARAAFEAARRSGEASGWAGGTVGAVAIDRDGRTAAATSTGGLSNKRAGRVGDSPIVGAGTYADDEAGAVSTTGNGEGMMRLLTASHAAERMRAGETAEDAVRAAIERLWRRLAKTGGAIAIDRERRFGVARVTATLSWACAGDAGERSGID